MEPRISIITLGVADFERSWAFYRALGALERDGRLRREGRRVALLEPPGADTP